MRNKYQGFTLVELLVVIAIIGVLMGLTIPAVQMARASARQAQCLNNIQQITKAAIGYQSTMQYFPYYESNFAGNRASWIVPLLPNLDEANLGMAWESGTATYKKVPVLFCPSNPLLKNANIKYPLSYVANCGYYDGSKIFNSDTSSVKCADLGTFTSGVANSRNLQNNAGRISALDGASYTVMFSENLQAGQWNNTDWCAFGCVWFKTDSPATHVFGSGYKDTTVNADHARPSSRHPNYGAHLSFVDGSARYVVKVDTTVYSQLMAPNDQKAASYSGRSGMNSATNFESALGK